MCAASSCRASHRGKVVRNLTIWPEVWAKDKVAKIPATYLFETKESFDFDGSDLSQGN
jgi:hypothetical protein